MYFYKIASKKNTKYIVSVKHRYPMQSTNTFIEVLCKVKQSRSIHLEKCFIVETVNWQDLNIKITH